MNSVVYVLQAATNTELKFNKVSESSGMQRNSSILIFIQHLLVNFPFLFVIYQVADSVYHAWGVVGILSASLSHCPIYSVNMKSEKRYEVNIPTTPKTSDAEFI